jgi:hypothetical protein
VGEKQTREQNIITDFLNFLPDELLSVSQKGICSMELVHRMGYRGYGKSNKKCLWLRMNELSFLNKWGLPPKEVALRNEQMNDTVPLILFIIVINISYMRTFPSHTCLPPPSHRFMALSRNPLL